MKKPFLILTISFTMIVNTICQNQLNSKIRELYLTVQSMTGNNFGIQFKTSLNDMSYLRFSLLELRTKQTNNLPAQTNAFSTHVFTSRGQIQAGIEQRKFLSDNSIIYYGIDIIGQSTFQRNRIDNPTISEDLRNIDNLSIQTGLGVVLGIMINFKNNFYFGTEIEPEFLFLYATNDNTQNNSKNKQTGFDFQLDSEIIKFSLIYRWNKNASR